MKGTLGNGVNIKLAATVYRRENCGGARWGRRGYSTPFENKIKNLSENYTLMITHLYIVQMMSTVSIQF